MDILPPATRQTCAALNAAGDRGAKIVLLHTYGLITPWKECRNGDNG